MNPAAPHRIARVLVIDDDAGVHAAFRQVLRTPRIPVAKVDKSAPALNGQDEETFQFELTSLYDGQEGLNAVQEAVRTQQPFSVAFVDIHMPGGWDGVETTKRLWGADPELQIVLCSAYSEYTWEDFNHHLGCSDRLVMLKKPFDIIEVRQLANAFSEKRRVGLETRAHLGSMEQTVQRRTEELSRSEERYKLLFDSNPLPTWVICQETLAFLAVNEAAILQYGYSREEFLAMTAKEIRLPDDVPALLEVIRQNQDRTLSRAVSRHRRKDGEILFVEITTHPITVEGRPAQLVVAQDVTQARKAEQQLRASEAIFRQITENITEVFWMTSADCNHLLYISPAYEHIWGRSCASLHANPVSWIEAILPEDRARVATAVATHYSEFPSGIEYRIVRPDGEIRYILDRAFPILGTNGQIDRVVGVAQDITERKHYDDAVQKQLSLQERVAKIAIHAPGVIYAFLMRADGSFCFPYCSPTMEKIYGLQPEELLNDASKAFERIHPEDLERVQRTIMESAASLSPWRSEFRVLNPKYGEIWAEGFSTPERTAEGGVLWHGFLSDITDRKHSEAELRKLSRAVEFSSASIAITNSKGAIEYVNPRFTAVTGYSFAEVKGKSLRILKSGETPPETYKRLWATITRGGEWRGEFRNKRKNGELFWESASISSVQDQQGRLTHYIAIKEDITEKRQKEVELQETNHRLIEATARAEGLASESKAANLAKSQFLANMSHEIRTPMNGVIGLTGLLLKTPLDTEQRHYAELLRNSGQSLLKVINDILDFSKVEAGKLSLEIQEFDLRDTIQDLVEVLAVQAREKSLEVSCSIAPNVPARLLSDSGRLRQILLNLGGNAVKFTEKGRVNFSVALAADTGPKAILRFAVTDSGPGIASHQIPALFTAFTQLDNANTRKFGGTGLGLALSKRLVEMLGGQIGVDSELGKGSTFWFTASASKPAPADASQGSPQVKESAPEPQTGAAGLRILIVEDDTTSQLVAAQLVKSFDCYADTVANGLEAITALRRTNYDVVLMDCQMPEMDGFEATGCIRNQSSGVTNPAVTIIALTASATDTDRSRCLAAGMNDYLRKPIDPAQLSQALARWSKRPLNPAAPAGKHDATPGNSHAIFDRAGLLQRLMGDVNLARTVAGNYLAEMPGRVEELLQAVGRKDKHRARLLAHQIKGASATVGGTALSRIAGEMELTCAGTDPQNLDILARQLAAQFTALAKRIAEETGAHAGPGNQRKQLNENVNSGR